MPSVDTIQSDFDRIALLAGDDWNANSLYSGYLLSHLKNPCNEALEIGCGTGEFSRRLAGLARRVTAVDLSAEMIRVARTRSRPYTNIDFMVGNVEALTFASKKFDCVASIATLHHLSLASTLLKMKDVLKVGGMLLVLDLMQSDGVFDELKNFVAFPVSAGARFLYTGKFRSPPEVRRAWMEHGRHDTYSTISEIRKICAEILPGAKLTQHLLWRYSILWQKS